MGIRRKLKGDDVKVIKDLDNKKVKREIDPYLQNRLAECHVTIKGEVRSLIFDSPVSRVPQPKLARMKPSFLLERLETQSSQICHELGSIDGAPLVEGSAPSDELVPSDHRTSNASTFRRGLPA